MLTGKSICGNWQLTTLKNDDGPIILTCSWSHSMATQHGSHSSKVLVWLCSNIRIKSLPSCRQSMTGDALWTGLKSSYPGCPEIFFCSWSSSKLQKFKRREILKWFCSSKIYLFKEVKKKLDISLRDHLFVVGEKKTASCPQRVAPHFLHFCIYLAEVLQGCHCFAQPSTKKEQQPKNLHTKKKRAITRTLHPGRLTWNLQISHLERKMIWTKPTGNYVPAVNLQGYKWTAPAMAFHQRYHHHPATALWSHATLPVTPGVDEILKASGS